MRKNRLLMKKILYRITQILNIVFVILTLALLVIVLVKKEWVEIALDWIESLIKTLGSWNYLIIFVTSMIESFPFLGVLVPGMNVMILVGGFFIGRDPQVFALCALIAAAGACLGNATGFLLGKFAGREFLAKHGNWLGIGATEMKYIEKAMKTK